MYALPPPIIAHRFSTHRAPPTVSDRLAVLPQYLLPKRALTQFGSLIASARGGVLTTRLIRWFVGKYKVNMTEAADPDIRNYASFNEFFTRALKVGARQLSRRA